MLLHQKSVWIVGASVPFESTGTCVGPMGLPTLVPPEEAERHPTREAAEMRIGELGRTRLSYEDLEVLGGGVAETGLQVVGSLRPIELRWELHYPLVGGRGAADAKPRRARRPGLRPVPGVRDVDHRG